MAKSAHFRFCWTLVFGMIAAFGLRYSEISAEQCLSNWYHLNLMCYQINEVQYTYDQAKQDCENQLASLAGPAELKKFLFDNGKNNNYYWLPENTANNKRCRRGTWEYSYSAQCFYKGGYICKQSTLKDGCPRGSFGWRDKCYYALDHQENLAISQKECWGFQQQGSLATIHDSDTYTFLTEKLKSKFRWLWIGLHKGLKDQENQYIWLKGEKVVYLPWRSDHTGHESEDCVTIDTSKQIPEFLPTDCSQKRPVLCEKDRVGASPVIDEGSNVVMKSCAQNWIEFKDFCYGLFNQRVAWSEAKDLCTQAGANLVSLHSEEENTFIKNRFGFTRENAVWIGLRKARLSNPLTWSDGTPLDYTNWHSGSLRYNGETCFEFNFSNMQWNALGCYQTMDPTRHTFICKKWKGEYITTTTATTTTTTTTTTATTTTTTTTTTQRPQKKTTDPSPTIRKQTASMKSPITSKSATSTSVITQSPILKTKTTATTAPKAKTASLTTTTQPPTAETPPPSPKTTTTTTTTQAQRRSTTLTTTTQPPTAETPPPSPKTTTATAQAQRRATTLTTTTQPSTAETPPPSPKTTTTAQAQRRATTLTTTTQPSTAETPPPSPNTTTTAQAQRRATTLTTTTQPPTAETPPPSPKTTTTATTTQPGRRATTLTTTTQPLTAKTPPPSPKTTTQPRRRATTLTTTTQPPTAETPPPSPKTTTTTATTTQPRRRATTLTTTTQPSIAEKSPPSPKTKTTKTQPQRRAPTLTTTRQPSTAETPTPPQTRATTLTTTTQPPTTAIPTMTTITKVSATHLRTKQSLMKTTEHPPLVREPALSSSKTSLPPRAKKEPPLPTIQPHSKTTQPPQTTTDKSETAPQWLSGPGADSPGQTLAGVTDTDQGLDIPQTEGLGPRTDPSPAGALAPDVAGTSADYLSQPKAGVSTQTIVLGVFFGALGLAILVAVVLVLGAVHRGAHHPHHWQSSRVKLIRDQAGSSNGVSMRNLCDVNEEDTSKYDTPASGSLGRGAGDYEELSDYAELSVPSDDRDMDSHSGRGSSSVGQDSNHPKSLGTNETTLWDMDKRPLSTPTAAPLNFEETNTTYDQAKENSKFGETVEIVNPNYGFQNN